LAAALKLSALAASYLGENVNISQRWLPVIAFAVVFIIIVLLVRLAAKALAEQTWWCFLFLFDLSFYFQYYFILCR